MSTMIPPCPRCHDDADAICVGTYGTLWLRWHCETCQVDWLETRAHGRRYVSSRTFSP